MRTPPFCLIAMVTPALCANKAAERLLRDVTFERTTGPAIAESPLPAATWGWREMALSVAIIAVSFLLLSAVIVALVSALSASEPGVKFEDTDPGRFAAALSTLALDFAALAAVYLLVRRSGGTWKDLGLRKPRHPRSEGRFQFHDSPTGFPFWHTVRLVGGSVLLAIVSVNLYGLAIDALGLDDLMPGRQIPAGYFDSALVIATLGLGIVFVAPVVEEVFFRGFIFGGMYRYLGFLPAAVVSGLVFSAVHGQVGLVLPFTFIGFILAHAYYSSGSLLPPILVHAIFNSFSFIVLLLVPEAR